MFDSKLLENLWFYDVFRMYRKGTLTPDELSRKNMYIFFNYTINGKLCLIHGLLQKPSLARILEEKCKITFIKLHLTINIGIVW